MAYRKEVGSVSGQNARTMAWLVEQAGGAATNGSCRILDIQPEKLHQRVAVFLGSKNEVERVSAYHQQ